MTPAEIIDAYVSDVARHLPGKMRQDVAMELRELLTESLNNRAQDAGRAADEALALELVREFGRPAEVAARYHQPFTLVEPADTRAFIILALVLVPLSGVLREVVNAAYGDRGYELPDGLGILGLLLLIFAIKNAIFRNAAPKIFHPESTKFAVRVSGKLGPWTPPTKDYEKIGWGQALGRVLGVGVFITAYLQPGWFVNTLSFGQLDAETYAYTGSFHHWSRFAWLPALLVIHAAVVLWAAFKRRWTAPLRWSAILIQVCIVTQIGWHLRYGDIFQNPTVDANARIVLALFAFFWAAEAGWMAYLELGRVGSPIVSDRAARAAAAGSDKAVKAARRIVDKLTP